MSSPVTSSQPRAIDDDLLSEKVVTPEQETALLLESNTCKAAANTLFAAGDYRNAFNKYHEAFLSCPKPRLFEVAVLHSNIAACQLKLQEWPEAIKSASSALAELDKLEQLKQNTPPDSAPTLPPQAGEEDADEEIISAGAAKAQPLPPPPLSVEKADILRIRCKALMRRARARSEAGGWQNLVGAEEDYKLLAGISPAPAPTPAAASGTTTTTNTTPPTPVPAVTKTADSPAPPPQSPNFNAGVHTILSPADKKIVRAQLAALPPRIKSAQEVEMAEMWGKLKSLGNGILKPFGLSTDNFQMVKDEKSGGYSMNFNQNPK
ncbi:Tetratricopeptide repeat protein 1 [Ceratocystis lukuohia]|uniref:Tetratricopeptide repeat protein 1 n=2 Tax=Ceratocystis TaxID=5157 RepID=A0A0F8B412_CERFI|nr:Tetratricopeptide repeat protein 1 [Ceratocystis platani]